MHKCMARCNLWYQMIPEGSYVVLITALPKILQSKVSQQWGKEE